MGVVTVNRGGAGLSDFPRRTADLRVLAMRRDGGAVASPTLTLALRYAVMRIGGLGAAALA